MILRVVCSDCGLTFGRRSKHGPRRCEKCHRAWSKRKHEEYVARERERERVAKELLKTQAEDRTMTSKELVEFFQKYSS